VFPKIGVTQNGWVIMEDPIEMDDLGVPLFSETSYKIASLKEGFLSSCCFFAQGVVDEVSEKIR